MQKARPDRVIVTDEIGGRHRSDRPAGADLAGGDGWVLLPPGGSGGQAPAGKPYWVREC